MRPSFLSLMMVIGLLTTFDQAARAQEAPAIAALPRPKAGQSPGEFIAGYAAEHGFSGTILVQKGGRVVFERSFGLANRAHNVPNANRTLYWAASITKLFTSTLILQLAEQQRLDLDRTIGAYLPEYRGEAATKVTVRQLLNHTSGLRNIDAIPNIEDERQAIRAQTEDAVRHARLPLYQTPYSSDDLLRKFCSDPLVGEPGKVFDYNSADYIILGKIIEQAYGKPFGAVLGERILIPLQMRYSGLMRHEDVVPNLADAYSPGADRHALQHDMPVYPENWYAAGALYSSVGDLLRFSNALFGGRLIGRPMLDQMTTPGLDRYGLGLWVYDTKAGGTTHRVAKRPGHIMGTQSQLYRFLDSDLTVIILSNAGTTDLDAFVAVIGKRMFE
ncbi:MULTISPECIES: serine hydrolase domain-containing protein [unclassified Sphingomonas]|nr:MULTISPECIES: serine hydrolase domain-containing protein [unclassified Sphingomonas]